MIHGAARLDRLPPRLPPVLYFGAAHLFLIVAFALVASDPAGLSGFFYQPRAVAVVHLMTLGWISASILGAIYIVGPMALRMPMPARRLDYVAFVFFFVGTAGMASHFWIARYAGMVWSAAMVVAALLHVAVRTLRGLVSAPVPRPVRLHLALAFLNVLAAAVVGMILGLHKSRPFLPGNLLGIVYGHAHLAALGWASMMVVGTGYRLLPMVLPSALPGGRGLYVSAFLLQIGAWGLFVSLATGSGRWLPLFALAAAGGLASFLLHVGWMRRHPRRPPPGLPLPEYGVGHAIQALAYAAAAAGLGMVLALVPVSGTSLRGAAAYGIFGLVGFLAQMVLGMEARILPMFAAYHANLNRLCESPPTMPHDMSARPLRAIVFWLWTGGVPILAAGLVFESPSVLAAGAWMLLAAAIFAGVNYVIVLRHVFSAPA